MTCRRACCARYLPTREVISVSACRPAGREPEVSGNATWHDLRMWHGNFDCGGRGGRLGKCGGNGEKERGSGFGGHSGGKTSLVLLWVGQVTI